MIWYTIPEAAQLAEIPERTLRRAIQKGQIPRLRLSPRRTWVYWDDVCGWLATRDTPSK